MAGDTTYQALERLSWMPDRAESDNGLVIAAQRYYDVKFTGGEIDGVPIGANDPAAGVFSTLSVTEDVFITGELNVPYLFISSPRKGTVTLNGATPVVVSNTSILSNSVVVFTKKVTGGTQGAYPKVTAISSGTSFTVEGTALDTSTYNYVIIN